MAVDKCFENKFVTVAARRLLFLESEAVPSRRHSTAVAERCVGAEYVGAEEEHLIVTVSGKVSYRVNCSCGMSQNKRQPVVILSGLSDKGVIKNKCKQTSELTAHMTQSRLVRLYSQ